jgi:hypothetical protein
VSEVAHPRWLNHNTQLPAAANLESIARFPLLIIYHPAAIALPETERTPDRRYPRVKDVFAPGPASLRASRPCCANPLRLVHAL